jgi:hypothetical protein
MRNNFFYEPGSSFSWHRLLHTPTGGLFIYFIPVEENKLITLVRPVFIVSFKQSSFYGVFIPSLEGRLNRRIKNLQKGWDWKLSQNKIGKRI